MFVRRLVSVLGIAAISVAGTLAMNSRSVALAPNDAPADSVAVRCAKAQLKLAELTYRKALDTNKRVPGTLAQGTLAQYAEAVEFAKLDVKLAGKSELEESLDASLARLELKQKFDEAHLKKVTDINTRSPGAVPAYDVERLQLALEVTKLQIEQGRALTSASPQVRLAWQLDVLNDELARVRELTNLLGQNRLSQ